MNARRCVRCSAPASCVLVVENPGTCTRFPYCDACMPESDRAPFIGHDSYGIQFRERVEVIR